MQKRKPFYPVEVPFLANLAKSYETSTVQNIAAAGATDGWLQSNFSSNDGLTLVEILLNMLVFDKTQWSFQVSKHIFQFYFLTD